jgi:hypothetical protein
VFVCWRVSIGVSIGTIALRYHGVTGLGVTGLGVTGLGVTGLGVTGLGVTGLGVTGLRARHSKVGRHHVPVVPWQCGAVMSVAAGLGVVSAIQMACGQ